MSLNDREILSKKTKKKCSSRRQRQPTYARKHVHCVTLFKDVAAKLPRSSRDVAAWQRNGPAAFLAIFFPSKREKRKCDSLPSASLLLRPSATRHNFSNTLFSNCRPCMSVLWPPRSAAANRRKTDVVRKKSANSKSGHWQHGILVYVCLHLFFILI